MRCSLRKTIVRSHIPQYVESCRLHPLSDELATTEPWELIWKNSSRRLGKPPNGGDSEIIYDRWLFGTEVTRLAEII